MEDSTEPGVYTKLRTPPRVIIGGGSITGLCVALMLEKVGIDFVVLEAYDSITPEAGAGIVCNANGFRILDQLGAYDDVMKAAMAPVQELNNWWPNGDLHSRNDDFSTIMQRLIGYPMVVLDRQQLLHILYSHIQDKTKVVTDARIISVDEDYSGVHVTIRNGRKFTGDILVGADGVHSFVRHEMWRLAGQKAPGYFSDAEIDSLAYLTPPWCRAEFADVLKAIKCNWITLFGISTLQDSRITAGSANTTFNHGMSFGVLSGGNNRRYFFLNKKLPRELKGDEICRYTDIDRDDLAKEYCNAVIQDDIKFGELYEARIRATLVPLEGYVFSRWHFGRIITLGDAAHKLHVVTGQGAMTGIEDGAVLVNQLIRQLAQNKLASLDTAQINEVFAKTQNLRESRSKILMRESFLTQSMHAWTNSALRFVAVHLIPKIGFDFILARLLDGVRPAPLVEALPKPVRKGLVGFDDEHQEISSAARYSVKFLAYLSLSLCGVWALCSASNPEFTDVGKELGPILAHRKGLFQLDMMGTLIIMLVEGWRRANKLSIIQWPIIWAILIDLAGLQVVAPFFYLTNFWVTSFRGRMQYTALSRPVILPAAKTILPAVFLLYLLPISLSTFLGRSDIASRFAWAVDMLPWAPFATCVALATFITSSIPGERDTFFGEKYLGYLRASYKCMFAALALLHLGSLGWQIKNHCLLWPLPARVAELVWLLAVYSEVRHYQHLEQHLPLHLALILLGFLVAGPGATAVAVWYWREEVNKRVQEKAIHQTFEE